LSAPDADVLVRQLSRAPGVEEPAGNLRTRVAGELTNLQQREFYWFEPGIRRKFRSIDAPIAAWHAAARGRAVELNELRTAAGRDVPTTARRTLQDVIAAAKESKRGAPRSTQSGKGKVRAATPWE
jgi:hypothetical protein